MRRCCTVPVAAAVLAATPAMADPSAATQPPTTAESGPTAAAVFYPAVALAAGATGQATIRCGRDAGMAYRDCTLVSESPAGLGFGAAALAMAAASPDNPKLNITDPEQRRPQDLAITFSLNPTAITPNLAVMSHVIVPPDLREMPKGSDISRYYPAAAARAHIGGFALIKCRISVAGTPVDCTVLEESPLGQGFGAAALLGVSHFRFIPQMVDGSPADGGTLRFPIHFAPVR